MSADATCKVFLASPQERADALGQPADVTGGHSAATRYRCGTDPAAGADGVPGHAGADGRAALDEGLIRRRTANERGRSVDEDVSTGMGRAGGRRRVQGERRRHGRRRELAPPAGTDRAPIDVHVLAVWS